MKVALIQNQIIWEDKIRNIARIEEIISNNPDMDFYLLPEMSFTGFSMNISKTAESGQETVKESERSLLIKKFPSDSAGSGKKERNVRMFTAFSTRRGS